MLIKKFSASWCGPCKSLSMTLAQVLPDYPDITIEEIDVDTNQDLTKEFNIRSVPTLIKFRDGVEVNRAQGALNVENLKRWLEN